VGSEKVEGRKLDIFSTLMVKKFITVTTNLAPESRIIS